MTAPRARFALPLAIVALVLFGGLFPSGAVARTTPATVVPVTASFANVSATANLAFAPDSFSVTPGSEVHLVVTQLADFAHTFVLSSVTNLTIPAGDSAAQLAQFFAAHPPLVNLSLGATPGVRFFANFTAPAIGTYEFVCTIHFADGMVGTMTVGSSSSSGSSSTSELIAIAVAVVIVVVVAVVLVVRRRRPPAPPAP